MNAENADLGRIFGSILKKSASVRGFQSLKTQGNQIWSADLAGH
jgi:hypothetical protein